MSSRSPNSLSSRITSGCKARSVASVFCAVSTGSTRARNAGPVFELARAHVRRMSSDTWRIASDDYSHSKLDQISRQRWQPVSLVSRQAIFDH